MKGVASALSGEAKTAGSSAGAAGGTAFAGGMGGALKALAPAALVAGIGVGLFKIGEDFDAAFDKIRVGTGETGQSLEGLKDSFKAVIQDVPTDFGSAADAISQINSMLGLTGPPLEALATQFLNLSRITGTDLSTNIESVVRLFGDWGVAAENQSTTLDKLFRASQNSGIGVSDLADLMVQFGAPLRQLGFDFDSAAAMFAKFHKEGVNITTLMPGFKFALKTFAKEGREPAEALRETFDQIRNAPSAMDATAIAMKIFGQRAGPDMAAAIREGRFELDDMMNVIKNGKDTINDAAEDTEDFGEKWEKFSNTVKVALEPLASAVFDALGDALEQATEFGTKFIDEIRFSFNAGGWEGIGQLLQDKFANLLDGILFKDQIIALVEGVFAILKTIFIGFFDTLRGLWDTFAGLFTGDWGRMWNGLVTLFLVPWNLIVGLLGGFVTVLLSVLAGAWDLIKLGAAAAWEAIKSLLIAAWEAIKGAAQAAWDGIFAVIQFVWGAILGFLQAGLAALGGIWNLAWEAMRAIAQAIWDAIFAVISFVWAAIQGFVEAGLSALATIWGFVWEAMKGVAETVWNAIMAVVSFVWNAIQNLVTSGLQALSTIWSFIWEAIKGVAETVWNAITGFIQGAWDTISGIFGSIVGGVQEIMDKFDAVAFASGVWNTVKDIITDAAGGIVGWLQGIASAVSGIINTLRDIPGAARDAIASLNPLKNVPGGGGIGGALGGGLLFGPPGIAAGIVGNFLRAEGGPVTRGSSYIVGEEGPELFTPSASGYITPNHELGATASTASDSETLAIWSRIERRLAAIERNQNSSGARKPSKAIVGARR